MVPWGFGMRTFGTAILSIALGGAAVAPQAAAASGAEARLVRELEEILRAPELKAARVGVHVRALSDDRSLFARNAERLFNPASNMKILTTAAALWYLGPSYRFRTEVHRDRNLQNGTLHGNLYVRGRGDPTLTTEVLFGLVNEVAMRGIKQVRGDLVVDASFFDEKVEGPGWEQEEGDHAYAAPMGALAVNFSTFSIRVVPGPRIGSRAVVRIWPEVPSLKLSSAVRTHSRGRRSRVWVGTTTEDDGSIRVSVRGSIGIHQTQGRILRRRVQNPTLFAGEMLRRMLALRGVEVRGKLRFDAVPDGRTVRLLTHWSDPLSSVVSTLNKYSNNFMAEQILKTLGAELSEPPGSWQKGTDALRQFLVELGVPDQSFVLGNGSGLNDVNRVTPKQMTQVLAAMYRRFEVRPEFVASLAVAGSSGTIVSRFEDSPAAMRLRAKTGSLTGVSALSGYVVTQGNRVLAFSIMMNDFDGRAREMWRVQDRIGVALARYQRTSVAAHP